ncbi:hypothetical protein EMCRGX_G006336 [Ephydatia muelleri]
MALAMARTSDLALMTGGVSTIRSISQEPDRGALKVHFDRLKPCVASTAEDPQNRRPSATPEVQVDRQPTGKNAELLDSDDDEPVAKEQLRKLLPPPPLPTTKD